MKTIIAEVVAAKKTKLKYQRITAALCVCIAALLASMFGAAVLASELSKEVRTPAPAPRPSINQLEQRLRARPGPD